MEFLQLQRAPFHHGPPHRCTMWWTCVAKAHLWKKMPGHHEHLEEIVNDFHLFECSCRYETFDECETISHGPAAQVTKVGIDIQLTNVGSILGRMAYSTISHPQI